LTARGVASCARGALGLYPGIERDALWPLDPQRLLFGVSFSVEDHAAKANATRVGRDPTGKAVQFHR